MKTTHTVLELFQLKYITYAMTNKANDEEERQIVIASLVDETQSNDMTFKHSRQFLKVDEV